MSIQWRGTFKRHKSLIFVILLVFLTLRVIVPQLDDLWDSIVTLKSADLWWVLLGVIIYFLGSPVLAAQINALALKPLKFLLTLKVQLAGLFVGKLLPNGIGSISLNIFYMIKKNHTPSQATTVMTMNAITSAIAYLFLILFAIFGSSITFEGLEGDIHVPTNLILFLIILLLGTGLSLIHSAKIRQKAAEAWKDLKTNFATYKERPRSVLIGVVCNGAGSLTSIFALFVSAKALGIELTFAEALLSYTFGNIAATLIPSPGGIGAVEAGIYSGLVLVGVEGPDATLLTLLYRLITYWITILPGYYFFHGLRKDLLANYNFKKNNLN